MIQFFNDVALGLVGKQRGGPAKVSVISSALMGTISGSGVASVWSAEAASAATGVSDKIISGVSNYPNPFDSRKGGEFGRTQITYTLGADADVTITIYDALGYIVKTMTSPSGGNGGKAGANFVPWDGRNAAGVFASKGGYIARIKVKAPGGSVAVTRKIGLIH